MPGVREAGGIDKIIGIGCSDLHLSDTSPIFRSAEPDWYAAQERCLSQLHRLAKSSGGVPVIVAGDVFHKWNPSPKLINFAIKRLPTCYAVPGQHDLRHHCLEDLQDTAYWTLCQAGKIVNLKPGLPVAVKGMVLHGFPWGVEPRPIQNHPLLEGFHVAVAHKYVWTKSRSYPGAPAQSRLKRVRELLEGFKAALFGDNHLGFLSESDAGCGVSNCGAFMRRNSDQVDYKPRVTLIHESGKLSLHELDVSEDKCLDLEEGGEAPGPDFSEFLEGLGSLQTGLIDFRESVLRACESGVPEGVRLKILEILGDAK